MREEIIGDCRLILEDCREVLPMLGRVDSVISDPPYEAVTQGKWGVLAGVEYRDFDDSALSFAPVDEIRGEVAEQIVRVCEGWAIVFCQAEGVRAWRDEFEKAKAKYKRAMVWIKPDAMPQFNGQGPSVGHEMMVAVWCGNGHSEWNGGGKPGTFVYPKNSGGKHEHPTQKPLPLMVDLVGLFSNVGGVVLDCFAGSGTTGVACVKLGRSFIGIEREEKYFDVMCRRIEAATKEPRLPLPEPKPVQQSLLDEGR